MARIVIEEPCEHGLFWTHWPDGLACPGGSRRVLDPGSYVLIEKVDGEWSDEVLLAALIGANDDSTPLSRLVSILSTLAES